MGKDKGKPDGTMKADDQSGQTHTMRVEGGKTVEGKTHTSEDRSVTQVDGDAHITGRD